MKKTRGFTLIELVVVMVILSILAVVAIPQFVDLRQSARDAAVAGVAGALSSAATLNYARRMANAGGSAVAACADVEALLSGGAAPAGYTIAGGAGPIAVGAVDGTCTVTHPQGGVANFTAIGA
jgi:MSHA pilin protein MshA